MTGEGHGASEGHRMKFVFALASATSRTGRRRLALQDKNSYWLTSRPLPWNPPAHTHTSLPSTLSPRFSVRGTSSRFRKIARAVINGRVQRNTGSSKTDSQARSLSRSSFFFSLLLPFGDLTSLRCECVFVQMDDFKVTMCFLSRIFKSSLQHWERGRGGK